MSAGAGERGGTRRPGQRRRAFTLMELIAVMIIVGVLAGLIVPRLLDTDRRRAETDVARVQGLLTAAAQRDAVSTEPLAIEYRADPPTLRLLQRPSVGVEAAWIEDRLSEPVELDAVQMSAAAADGTMLDPRGWVVPFGGSQQRPAISVRLTARRGDEPESWQIDLLPQTTAATVKPAAVGTGLAPIQPRAVDLDDSGRGDQPW